MKQGKKILVAPLNWGLGHAARCIPLISEMQHLGAEVIIGADGAALALLRKEFPALKWIHMPGTVVRYQEKGSLALRLMLQLPKLLTAVIAEHRQLKKIIAAEKIDAVIADNRYGLFARNIPSVFITHQATIRLPVTLQWMATIVNVVNHFFISKFDNCWIADAEGPGNWSGDLSKGLPATGKVVFIGPLSRFNSREESRKYDILILLSGPEPQRTLLETKLTGQFMQYEKTVHPSGSRARLKVLLVRGVMEGTDVPVSLSENFTKVDYLLTRELNSAILSAGLIIARPGYTTIMDLAAIGGKAIFIPTPGQTEQEYLSNNLMQRGICYSATQELFDLQTAVSESGNYHGFTASGSVAWKEHVREWLERIEA
ncbi:MAG: hypothetical protein K1X61_01425 [Chitinophagales bacterium]|nr:hypothetical protein [Chitinophagales bacterium]